MQSSHEVGEQEWEGTLLPAYKQLSHRAEALIAEAYLADMNTRRVRRALAKLFEGHIGKDVVSRKWQRTRSAWQPWQERDLAGDDNGFFPPGIAASPGGAAQPAQGREARSISGHTRLRQAWVSVSP